MLRALLMTLILSLLAGGALALDTGQPFAFGPRAGYTSWDGLEQAHVGAHAVFAEMFPNVDFTPNLEIGFGDEITLVTINGDITYRFTELTTAPWGLYGGGALSAHIFDGDFLEDDFELGLNAVVGGTHELASGHRLLAEVRFGILDSPDFKLTCGVTFSP